MNPISSHIRPGSRSLAVRVSKPLFWGLGVRKDADHKERDPSHAFPLCKGDYFSQLEGGVEIGCGETESIGAGVRTDIIC